MFGVILGSLSSVLGVVAKLMPTLVKIVGTELVTFAKALEAFFRVLGLLKPDEQVEEIGDKALQAEKDEVSPIQVKDFDSHENTWRNWLNMRQIPKNPHSRRRMRNCRKGLKS